MWHDLFFFFSSRRRHTRYWRDWSSDVCSSDLRRARCSTRPAPPRVRGSWNDPISGAAVGAARPAAGGGGPPGPRRRSGEGRGGEEGRFRGGPDHLKKKKEDTSTAAVSTCQHRL